MANGKWVTGVSRRDGTSSVALATLRQRLAVVQQRLPLAAERAGEDIEHVHQLRVSSRRAVAAVQMYQDLLPRRSAKKLQKQLKRIRRAAGQARDLDVLLGDTSAARELQEHTGLIAQLQASRERAQEPIVELQQQLATTGALQESIDQVLAHLENRSERAGRSEPRFGKWARAQLQRKVKRFFKAEPKDWQDLAALHRFRIRGKELRYTMELLAGAFPKKFRNQLYPQLAAVQEKLGVINDHCAALARFERWRDSATASAEKDQFADLLATRRTDLGRSRQEFVEWWEAGRDQKLRRGFREMIRH